MTEEQKQSSIRNKKLQLSFWDKISHFGIVIFLFFIPIISIFVYLKDPVNETPKLITEGEIYLLLIPTLLALVFYKIQADRLKFKEVHTTLSKQQLTAIIEKTGNLLKWRPEQITDDFIIAKTNPSFFSGSWGEQITILFDNNRVLINSICDPDRKSSVLSMGRNKKNVNKLIRGNPKCQPLTRACQNTGRTIKSSASVRYQLLFRAGQTSLGSCVQLQIFSSKFNFSSGRTVVQFPYIGKP